MINFVLESMDFIICAEMNEFYILQHFMLNEWMLNFLVQNLIVET